MNANACEICKAPTPTPATRCTNGRCLSCHRKYCTLGGSTAPGHGRLYSAPATEGTALATLT